MLNIKYATQYVSPIKVVVDGEFAVNYNTGATIFKLSDSADCVYGIDDAGAVRMLKIINGECIKEFQGGATGVTLDTTNALLNFMGVSNLSTCVKIDLFTENVEFNKWATAG